MFKLNPSPKTRTAIAVEQYRAGNTDYLIRYLRSGEPLTAEIRDFLAQILEGGIKKKRGPKNQPRPGNTIADVAPQILLEFKIKERYAFQKLVADILEPSDAHLAAVAAVAKELDVTESAVDKTIYPRMRTASRKLRKK